MGWGREKGPSVLFRERDAIWLNGSGKKKNGEKKTRRPIYRGVHGALKFPELIALPLGKRAQKPDCDGNLERNAKKGGTKENGIVQGGKL